MLEMGVNGAAQCFEFMVREVAVFCGFSYNCRDFAIVDMADMWEKVVFDLVVQSSGEPVYHSVFGSEIRGGVQLMDCPGIFYFAVFIRDWICGFFNDMGELEN